MVTATGNLNWFQAVQSFHPGQTPGGIALSS
jgi:hypothetical protein